MIVVMKKRRDSGSGRGDRSEYDTTQYIFNNGSHVDYIVILECMLKSVSWSPNYLWRQYP